MKEDDELTAKEGRQAFAGAQNDLCGGDDYVPPSLAEVGSATEQVWLPYLFSSLSFKTSIGNTWNYWCILYSLLLRFFLPKSRIIFAQGITQGTQSNFRDDIIGNGASCFLLVNRRKLHAIDKSHHTL